MRELWQLRRRIVSRLETAPMERRAGLRASLRGIDLVLRAVIEKRVGGQDGGIFSTSPAQLTWMACMSLPNGEKSSAAAGPAHARGVHATVHMPRIGCGWPAAAGRKSSR
jgi:hypothetical protein